MEDATVIKGEILLIKDKQTFDSGFVKQEIVVKTPGDYPQEIPIEFCREEKIELVGKLRVGDTVEVHCNMRGNAWKDRHFLSLNAWRVEGGTREAAAPPPPTQHQAAKQDGYAPEQDDDDGQIPF